MFYAALGVILYELLSGRRPHEGESLLEILHKILTEPAPRLERLVPGLPARVYDIVRRAMAPSAEVRLQTAAELADALAPFAGGGPNALPSPLAATREETGHLPAPGPATVRIPAIVNTQIAAS